MSTALTGLVGVALGASISLIGQWIVQKSNIQVDTRKQRFDAYLDFLRDSSSGCRLANSIVQNEESWKRLLNENRELNEEMTESELLIEQSATEQASRLTARDRETGPPSQQDLKLDEQFLAQAKLFKERTEQFERDILKNDQLRVELADQIPVLRGEVDVFLRLMDSSLFKMQLISPPLILQSGKTLRKAIDRRAAGEIGSAELERSINEYVFYAHEDLKHSIGWTFKSRSWRKSVNR